MSRKRTRGFTLIELIISLAATLVITLGVAGLSHVVSDTFNEEIRVAGAQAGLRTAIDRLRADLQRAAFQSTGNIASDTVGGCVYPGGSSYGAVPPLYAPILRLAGIRLYDGAQNAIALPDKNVPLTLPLSATNSVAPDAIDIAGNMTGLDWFEAREPVVGAGSAGCSRIYVNESSLAMYRIQQASTTNIPLWWRNLFQPTDPGTGTTPGTDVNAQFIVRFQDAEFRSWYLATCKTSPAAGVNLGAAAGLKFWIDIDPASTIPTKGATNGTCGLTGTSSFQAYVNPVHIVRWQIEPDSVATDGLNPEKSAAKYDLTRTFVDAVSGKELTTTKEHVAEYAVDLKFAVAWDNESTVNPKTPTPQLLQYQLDDGQSITVAPDVTTLVAGTGKGPERIRSVMVRVATRGAFGDRSAALALANPAQYKTTLGGNYQAYLYRYALGTTTAPFNFARVRTVVTEVALQNQMSLYY